MRYYISLAVLAILALAAMFIRYMRREAGRVVLETVRLSGSGAGDRGDTGANAGDEAGTGIVGEAGAGAKARAKAESGDALRVVQLSDIHIKVKSVPPCKIIGIVRDAAPHIVILTGDYIDSAADAGSFLSLMGGLVEAAGGAAFYMCFGNHDNRVFKRSPALKLDLVKKLKRLGIYIMEDRTLTYAHGGRLYAVTGFSDLYSAAGNIQSAYSGIPKDADYCIGFSHNPDLALKLERPRPDLFMCGHFHGGQIWLPFRLEYTCLRKEILCNMGICRGLHSINNRNVYISRGVGCVAFPLRLGSRPEITLFLIP